MLNINKLLRLCVQRFASRLCWRGRAIIVLMALLSASQSSAQTSVTDGSTPLGLSPGAPAGSYALSDFDTVNLFNGNLNFHLPLLQVGGRGQATIPLTLMFERHWKVEMSHDTTGGDLYRPNSEWWNSDTGYGSGVLLGRQAGTTLGVIQCNQVPPAHAHYGKTLTRLTFTAPEGTEYELLDALTNGAQADVPRCPTSGTGFSRGKVFVTADGTSATFISDAAITDAVYIGTTNILTPSGYMLLSDGTRYRIDSGNITWVRDRNGNQLTFSRNGNRTTITDSLNRIVTIDFNVDDVAPYGLCDKITYKGFGGAERVTRISKTHLANALRTTQAGDLNTVQTYKALFQLLDGTTSNFDPIVISAVWLPDGDGTSRKYQLSYNVYGELARVVLPTGGAIEYDYAVGLQDGNADGVINSDGAGIYEIYRRVVERRVYVSGNTPETKMTYSRPETSTTNLGYIELEHWGAGDVLLGGERHYYNGSARASFNQGPVSYPAWRDGRETETETYDANRNVLQRVNYTWNQPVSGSAWPLTQPETNNLVKPNSPQITEITTTLVASASKVSRQTFAYDRYVNRTDTYEYDYGDNQPPAYAKRHTHTDYLTANVVSGTTYNYDTLNPSAEAPVINDTIHIRNLPAEQFVYAVNPTTGAETTEPLAHIKFSYDQSNLTPRTNISGLCLKIVLNTSPVQCDNTAPAGYVPRGNLTRTASWRNTDNVWINTDASYDIAGNMVETIDARGHTSFGYDDYYGAPDGDAASNSAPSELGAQTSFAFATSATNALGHTVHTQYDYYLGKPVDVQDANSVVVSYSYDEPLDRPTQIVSDFNNLAAKSLTSFSYDDTNRTVTTTSDQAVYNDKLLKSQTLYDALGRTIETRQYETATSYIAVKQVPFVLEQTPQADPARASSVSNPYRPGQESPVYTTTYFDALGRVTTLKFPDDAVVATSYNGNQTLITDQASRQRMSQSDAFGQLTDVWEITPDDSNKYPGITAISFNGQSLHGYLTHYDYDALGNLKQVTQGLQPPRTFTYNSLKQLTDATNPESGHITYDYDAKGNLWHKTDARNIITTYEYDAANRIKSRTYQNDASGTPAVYYKYDAQALPAGAPTFDRGSSTGRLVATLYGSDTSATGNYQGYDAVGRVKRSYQVTNDGQANQTYAFSNYDYDLAGDLKSQIYPSGRAVSTTYDRAGRISNVTGTGRSVPYADSFAYASHGGVREMKLGNGLWEHTQFNSRLQPTELDLGSQQTGQGTTDRWKLAYSFESLNGNGQPNHDNSGNVLSQTISVPNINSAAEFTVTQYYSYDALNRLSAAQELNGLTQSWKQVYSYDRFGNRNFAAGTTLPSLLPQVTDPLVNPHIDQSNNRLDSSATGQGNILYDDAGNLTRDANAVTYSYDAENQMTKYAGGDPLAGGSNYGYDGDGRRVRKTTPGGTTIFVYNASGQLIAEYCNNAQRGNSGGTSYMTDDNLGTPRLVTGTDINDAKGGVLARHDYLPFGEEIGDGIGPRIGPGHTNAQGEPIPDHGYVYGSGLADTVRQKFTGKERDGETGWDYFGARYYNSQLGRFMSADPAGPDLTDPQTLNRYRYGLNNPLRYIDKKGLYEEDVHRGLTEVLAFAAGYSADDARRIANADQGVDDNPATSPFGTLMLNFEARRLYHFTTAERRRELWGEFVDDSHINSEDALRGLGVYLHAEQDSFSHAGFGPNLGHLLAGHYPDETWTDVSKATEMGRTTYDTLVLGRSIMNNFGLIDVTSKPIGWTGKLYDLVLAFSAAETKQAKYKILEEIRDYVIEERRRQQYIAQQLKPLGAPPKMRTRHRQR